MRLVVTLLALFLSLPAHAQEWWEAETDRFIVKSRSNEAEARTFAEELERYDGALRTLQNIQPSEGPASRSNKVTIFRFGDQRDIAQLAGVPGGGIAGFYIPRAGNSVAFAPVREERRAGSVTRRDGGNPLDGMSVLKHEYAHHFMMQYFPSAYPRWYVEGYAETVATIRFLDDGSFHVGDPPQYRAEQVLRMPAFRLREMLDANRELTGWNSMQHYGTGWLLSHYLNFDEEGRSKLTAFLGALAAGEDSLTAAQRILGDLNALDRKLATYRRGRFPGLNVRPANYTPPQIAMRRLPADEVALINQKMQLWRGVTKKEAPAIRNTVLSRIASHPNSVEAHLLLAEASYDAENYPAAAEAAAKAAELDPRSTRAWLYRGMAAMKQAEADPAAMRTAREHFAHAARLDPGDPRPLIQFYRSYADGGGEVPEEAILALESAYDMSGSDSTYRMLLSRQLLREKRFPDARSVIMPVAFQGHATGEADADEEDPTPRRLFDAIDRQDADAAIAMIDKYLEPDDEDKKGG